ncbi:MAG: hypothetical protein Q8789_02365, partial [Sweet potato little leaf phytoplasma]|nr:hypothetical protein [Sweet potato little leaf phytoplasma]
NLRNKLSMEVLNFISSHFGDNIRELEGVLLRLLNYTQIYGLEYGGNGGGSCHLRVPTTDFLTVPTLGSSCLLGIDFLTVDNSPTRSFFPIFPTAPIPFQVLVVVLLIRVLFMLWHCLK